MSKSYSSADIQRMLANARATLGVKNETIPVSGTEAEINGSSIADEILSLGIPTVYAPDISESEIVVGGGTESTENQQPNRLGVARDDITYNTVQQEFIDRASAGESIVLIGAAGTGKTTCQRGLAKKLIVEGRIKPLSRGTKWLQAGLPGIAVVSFTNKAVNNIRHAMPEIYKPHCLTIHKLLEYAPEFFEIEDPEHPGEFRKTMRFVPTRTRFNPLPSELRLIVIEEGSMVDVPLHDQLMDACPHRPQIIYLGDIQQLPPVFGSSILGFKMLELPVIELKEVYRQARNSPIIDLAWKILEGNIKIFDSRAITVEKEINGKQVKRIEIPALKALTKETPDGTVIFQPWQKQLSADMGLLTCVKQFCQWADGGYYDANDDIILCPFNVSFGTVEINKGISQHLGRKRRAVVFEVVAGFQTHYLAEGDRVLFEKEDATITKIIRNAEYLGKSFQTESIYLDRWGHLRTEDMDADALDEHKDKQVEGFDLTSIEKYIEAAAAESEDRVTAASHRITLTIKATGEEREIDTAGEVNNLLGGYAITVHKSQGSEWNKVFIVMQHTHATMNQRELLYTAVTRAKKHLHIICEPNTFERGINSQKVKGNSLEEKAEYFKGKVAEREKELAAKKALEDSDPAKLAFAKVGEWDKLMRDAVNHWWAIAQQFYPKLKTIKAPAMTWEVTGDSAGTAMPELVTFNPVYLHIDPTDMISDTCPHEVAHSVVSKNWGRVRDPHGAEWKEVMHKFGRNPLQSKFHKLGDLPKALQQFALEAAKAKGERPEEVV
jgi:hypothetical protein